MQIIWIIFRNLDFSDVFLPIILNFHVTLVLLIRYQSISSLLIRIILYWLEFLNSKSCKICHVCILACHLLFLRFFFYWFFLEFDFATWVKLWGSPLFSKLIWIWNDLRRNDNCNWLAWSNNSTFWRGLYLFIIISLWLWLLVFITFCIFFGIFNSRNLVHVNVLEHILCY